MSKFSKFILFLLLILLLCSCNKQLKSTQTYDYAIIKLQNGEVIETQISSWKDLEQNNIEVTTKDGVTYRVNSSNITLVHD